MILGLYNPSGRLVTTWPASDAALPPIADYNMAPSETSPGRTYQYLDELRAPPLFRFAEGLSYGHTTLSEIVVVSGKTVNVCDDITLKVGVH
eukprot:SAG31_NODE_14283_length_816_cov_2.464435_1_plen_91_part_10